jgi:hypothetical protein
MKIVYEVGPEKIAVGGIEFFLNVPKEIDDEMAEKILAKKTIIFRKMDGVTKPPKTQVKEG